MCQGTPAHDAATEAADLLASALGRVGLAWNGAGHLTCSETDAIARALVLLGKREAAEELVEGHAAEDEEGDRHFQVVVDRLTAESYVTTL